MSIQINEEQRNEYDEQYKKDYVIWETKKKEILNIRKAEYEKQILGIKLKTLKDAESKFQKTNARISKELNMLNEQLVHEQEYFSSLSVLSVFKKIKSKKEIEKIQEQITAKQIDIKNAEADWINTKNNIESIVNKQKTKIEKELKKKYRMPHKPHKPFSIEFGYEPTPTQIANLGLSYAIYDYLWDNDTAMTVQEMIEEIPAMADLSNSKVYALLQSMVKKKQVRSYKRGENVYYQIVEEE